MPAPGPACCALAADAGAGTDGDAGDQEAEADGVPGDEMAGEADEAEEEL